MDKPIKKSRFFIKKLYEKNKSLNLGKIKNEYCRGNLFILPSLADSDNILNEYIEADNLFNKSYNKKFSKIISTFINKYSFIIIDTRGGSDLSSINACTASDGYIVVTEADKTSWDTGKLLLKTIRNSKERNECLGFIINKNILPAEAIVTFLKKEWRSPHLVTIPLDIEAIKEFQLDNVPIATKPTIAFSKAIVEIVQKIVDIDQFDDNQKHTFQKLIDMQHYEKRKSERIKYRIKSLDSLMNILNIFVPLLAMILMFVFINKNINSFAGIDITMIVFTLLIFISLMSSILPLYKKMLERLSKYIEKS